MPIKNPEKRRTYHREYKRLRRTGECQPPGQTLVPVEFRLQTARDVLTLIDEQVKAVRCSDAGELEKARCVGYLVGIALRAIEVADLSGRINSLEAALGSRRTDP